MKKAINKITDEFLDVYLPTSVLVTYKHLLSDRHNGSWQSQNRQHYVESFDTDKQGRPINPHPLTHREAISLSKTLYNAHAEKTTFIKPAGILPRKVIHIDPTPDASKAIWYTPASIKPLFFVKDLNIPSGKAYVPALIWKASKTALTLFALPDNKRPKEDTPLFQAPFLNVYGDGRVCMGNVDVNIKKSASLEEFMRSWEAYFFGSYFSHTIAESPINGNVILLWQNMIASQEKFPVDALKKTRFTVKNLIK